MLIGLLGHECRATYCGRDALAIARDYQPDVAILDIGLPDLSGYEVAAELRKTYAGRELYLAAITGWGQPEDRIKAFAAGFDHHVLKPADGTKIREILRLADRARRPINVGVSHRT